jgi:hypothetical protein
MEVRSQQSTHCTEPLVDSVRFEGSLELENYAARYKNESRARAALSAEPNYSGAAEPANSVTSTLIFFN